MDVEAEVEVEVEAEADDKVLLESITYNCFCFSLISFIYESSQIENFLLYIIKSGAVYFNKLNCGVTSYILSLKQFAINVISFLQRSTIFKFIQCILEDWTGVDSVVVDSIVLVDYLSYNVKTVEISSLTGGNWQ